MRIRNTKSIFQVSLFVGFLITIYHLLSGEGVDAVNYLTMRANDVRGVITWSEISSNIFLRHNIPFILIYPFTIFGFYLGGILYLLMSYFSLIYIIKKINLLTKENKKSKSGYQLIDFILLSPYVLIYILEPGKESIVFYSICASFLMCYKLNKSISLGNNNFKTIDTIGLILILLLAINIRFQLIFILPAAILFSFRDIFKIIKLKFRNYRFNIQYFAFIALLNLIIVSLILILIFRADLIYQNIFNLYKYGAFVYDGGLLNTGLDFKTILNNESYASFILISSFIFGFPLTPAIINNYLCIFAGSSYFLSTISLYIYLIPKLKRSFLKVNLYQLINHQKISKENFSITFISLLLIILLILGGIISSVGLTFNTGTGIRWASPYIVSLWLTAKFIKEK